MAEAPASDRGAAASEPAIGDVVRLDILELTRGGEPLDGAACGQREIVFKLALSDNARAAIRCVPLDGGRRRFCAMAASLREAQRCGLAPLAGGKIDGDDSAGAHSTSPSMPRRPARRAPRRAQLPRLPLRRADALPRSHRLAAAQAHPNRRARSERTKLLASPMSLAARPAPPRPARRPGFRQARSAPARAQAAPRFGLAAAPSRQARAPPSGTSASGVARALGARRACAPRRRRSGRRRPAPGAAPSARRPKSSGDATCLAPHAFWPTMKRLAWPAR